MPNWRMRVTGGARTVSPLIVSLIKYYTRKRVVMFHLCLKTSYCTNIDQLAVEIVDREAELIQCYLLPMFDNRK